MTTKIVERPLTEQQEKVFRFLKDNSFFSGPTVRQIQQHFGFKSPNGVICHLDALERKGFITRRPKVARGIEVVR